MSKRWIACATMILAGVAMAKWSAAVEKGLVLVADGQSAYAIVVPDAPDPRQRVSRAANLLRSCLAEATGAELSVVAEGKRDAAQPAIYLGMTQAARKAKLPLDKIEGMTCLKAVRGRDVFLVGNDASGGIERRKYVEYLGTLKATTWFLEEQVGVRFLLPGPNGLFVPKRERLAVPCDLDAVWSPTFAYVRGRNAGDIVYSVANNFFYFTPVVWSYGGHSYYSAVPRAKYAKTNPDYFALRNGVRSPAGNHLCISNPKVQELMVEEMLKRLDMGYDWVELAQTDGYLACECEECKAIHPDEGERLWVVHRKLAERIKKLRPGKKVMIISYGPTTEPPKTFAKFPDNVVIQMCHYSPEAFDAWKPYNVPKTVYVYNWGTYQVTGFGPKRTPRYASDQIKRFVANRVLGIYMCGAFENLGLEGPVYYVYGKTIGDPALDCNALVEDYYRAAFGKARAPMKAFFTAMYERMELFCALNRPNFRMEMEGVRAFQTPEDVYCHFFPAKLLDAMQKSLDRAKALATDARVKARIRVVELEFSYVKNLAAIFQLYRVYRLEPNWQTFGLLAQEIDARNAMLDSWFDKRGRFIRFDGWPRIFGGQTKAAMKLGGRLRGTLSAPVNWNTDLLREKNILPGVGTKSAKVARVTGIKLDGKLDDAAWQKIGPEELGEIGLGELKNKTSFKIGYDDAAIYFGIDCELANVRYLAVKPCGRDGACYRVECMEILLDPFGEREKYYHFILNPVPNSIYDARVGFITDPIHPLYGKPDKAWNGDWSYAPLIDKAGKRWTAEVRIPFRTLGVSTPQPGASWTMNLGREHFPLGPKAKRKGPVLSLWSPNFEEQSFHSTAAFGNLVFE